MHMGGINRTNRINQHVQVHTWNAEWSDPSAFSTVTVLTIMRLGVQSNAVDEARAQMLLSKRREKP